MKCERCGAELLEGDNKCFNCGFENTDVDMDKTESEDKNELIYAHSVPSVIEADEEEKLKKTFDKKWIFKIISVIVAFVSLGFCFYGAHLLNEGSKLMTGDLPASFGMIQIFGNSSYTAFGPVFDGFAHFVRAVGIVSAYFVVYCGFKRK